MNATRSLLFGLVTVGLTVLAHAAVGGLVPDPVGLAVLVLVTSALARPVLRRQLRPTLLLAVTAAEQVVLHPAVQVLAPDPAGHGAHAAGPAMVGAHAAAGVLGALLVTVLDPVLRCLGRSRPPAPRFRVVPTSAAADVGTTREPGSSAARLVSIAAPRRGPPAPLPAR